MAIGTATAIALGVSAAASAAQAASGAARAKKAKKALEKFQRQELKNVTKDLKVSTLGAQLQTQEAQRRFATGVDALRSGGVRGLVGGLSSLEQQQQVQQQQIAAGLDMQQAQIDQMRVQDEANIRQMQEQRESSQIAGLGAEIAAGRQQVNAGLQGIGQTALSAATLGLTAGAEGAVSAGKAAEAIQAGTATSSMISGLTQGQAQRAANKLQRSGYTSQVMQNAANDQIFKANMPSFMPPPVIATPFNALGER